MGGRFGPNGIGHMDGFDGRRYVVVREDIITAPGFDVDAALAEWRRVRDIPDKVGMLSTVDPVEARGRQCAVYRLYDVEGRLLYVGKSIRPKERLRQHELRAWWPEVDPSRTRFDWFPNERRALDVEADLIRSESPAYNQAGVSR